MKKIFVPALLVFLIACCFTASAKEDSTVISSAVKWRYPNVEYTYSTDESGKTTFSLWKGDAPSPTKEQLAQDIHDYMESSAYATSNFRPEVAIAREAQVFSAEELFRLRTISYNVNEYIRYKNFWGGTISGVHYDGLRQFLLAAMASGDGLFTQADYDKLNGVLKEQGIDLDGTAHIPAPVVPVTPEPVVTPDPVEDEDGPVDVPVVEDPIVPPVVEEPVTPPVEDPVVDPIEEPVVSPVSENEPVTEPVVEP